MERGPRPEPHERRHLPSRYRHLHVIARESDFVDAFLSVELAFETGDFIDLRRIERRECGETGREKNRNCDQMFFSLKAGVGPAPNAFEAEPQHSQLMLFVLFFFALFLALFVLAQHLAGRIDFHAPLFAVLVDNGLVVGALLLPRGGMRVKPFAAATRL